ncbi:hypothetical protein LP416_26005 [Polaromonas sp. P2-4]|nr:hypothetical protein LP416_26005 [Polaromonas sp. P2-4]
MLHTLITVLHFIAAAGAIAFWALGMYFWYLQNHSSKPGTSQRRQRTILSFVAMAVLGVVALGLRMLKESVTAA